VLSSAFRRLDTHDENASDENGKPPEGGTQNIRVFTTRIDTIYGANAIVVAAEHPIIEAHRAELSKEVSDKIEEIKREKAKPTDYGEEVEKDGIDTGLKAINPFSGETLPVWIGNYVMMEYGTGAVMSVPAHDERDFEFAKKFGLPMRQVITGNSPNSDDKSPNSSDVSQNSSDGLQIPSGVSENLPSESQSASDVSQSASQVSGYASDVLQSDASGERYASGVSENLTSGERYASDGLQYAGQKSGDSNANSENTLEAAFTQYGVLINSGEWSGKSSAEAKREMADFAAKNGFGEFAVTYRLRDWGISRQRFWGAPIPIIYCETCGAVPEKYENLPVRLPETAPFTGVGESPLARVPEFVNTTCPKCGEPAKRETDTMDTFVDSSWYYFRYTDPHDAEMPFKPEIASYWLPVDQYIGGVDHAVMHLLYTRFWSKVMRDIGLVTFDEPIEKLLTQGMVVGESFYSDEKSSYVAPDEVEIVRDAKGKVVEAKLKSDESPVKVAIEKMSKSKYNGVDPDDMIESYGADATRIFALFAAPAENELVWQETGIEGAVRFLQRVYRFVFKWVQGSGFRPLENPRETEGSRFDYQELGWGIKGLGIDYKGAENKPPGSTKGTSIKVRKLRQKTHQTIKRVTENFESYQFNTPIAALMELSNALSDFDVEPMNGNDEERYVVYDAIVSLILMLAPYAPHFAEEMWEILTGETEGILASRARFPIAEESYAKADEIEIPIQVNGKLRSRITTAPETSKEDLEKMALTDTKIREYTDGKQIVKIVVVPNRLVNVVVK
ncbi:MAG: class I tRNA ligase family protein, partial [Pyrinomonadaceae bacterium]